MWTIFTMTCHDPIDNIWSNYAIHHSSQNYSNSQFKIDFGCQNQRIQPLCACFRAEGAKIGTFKRGVSAALPPKHPFEATVAYGDNKKRFLWFKLRIAAKIRMRLPCRICPLGLVSRKMSAAWWKTQRVSLRDRPVHAKIRTFFVYHASLE